MFLEGVTSDFPYESIYESLKLLLRGTEKDSAEYVEKYFEFVRVPYVQIKVSQVEQLIPDFYKTVEYPLFDPKKTTFFMMDHKIWNGVQRITEGLLKDAILQEEKLDSKLKKTTGIAKDYDLLLELHTKKILFVNIF
ncbi:hypothetical protein NC995_11080 [Leptolyngbya sp. FACHB-1515]